MPEKKIDTPVQYLKGVGPKKAKVLAKIGINTIEDLMYYFPRWYEDRRKFLPISKLKEGECCTVKGKILASGLGGSWKRSGFKLVKIAVSDDSGKIYATWFNQPYLVNYFKADEEIILYGRLERYKGSLEMVSPEFELLKEEKADSLSMARIVPIYSLTVGISQRYFRKLVKNVLDESLPHLKEIIPYDIRSRHSLFNLARSLLNIHFPVDDNTQKESYKRLAFEEFFLYQIPIILRKMKAKEKMGISHNPDSRLSMQLKESLPFKLTQAQDRVLEEIKIDLASIRPMQRLLQGDVGSGKTIVAVLASMIVIDSGYQAAFMVPTEILAKQHYEKVRSQIQDLRTKNKEIKIGLLTSSINKKERDKIYQQIKEGKVNLIIGTHALLEEAVVFEKLGLVVIDEQHKFGVAQRALLPQKGVNPDVLIMTATPIPRTLALTIYGDLDISTLDEMPPARLPVKTLWYAPADIKEVEDFTRERLKEGRQVYVVYPIIEESASLDLKAAEEMYEELKTKFSDFKVGLIHGRLKQALQNETMQKFSLGEIQVLVATTVLEVGIDVANATCLVIEEAQRFGLSQLHQLRGRVGRSNIQSYCILVADARTDVQLRRIQAITNTNDGFRIAEEDLKLRGPGEFFGSRQHGLSGLRIANPLTQMRILKSAREEVIRLLNTDPGLTGRNNLAIKETLSRRFPEYEQLMAVA
ncbi:MAG: ATP-dependent DNA helicase RecG [Candidatus Omnitrophota bacterium]